MLRGEAPRDITRQGVKTVRANRSLLVRLILRKSTAIHPIGSLGPTLTVLEQAEVLSEVWVTN